MEIIVHRRNTVEQLRSTPTRFGVEVDIRSWGDELILHHDPFVKGDLFHEWLTAYSHGTLILNVKEEGLEQILIDYMRKFRIRNYFFLDQSFPFLLKYARLCDGCSAVRISEFESIETVLAVSGLVKWVWVDCFTRFPLDFQGIQRLKNAGFKLCLVSPELHGRDVESLGEEFFQLGINHRTWADAVCTKGPEFWEERSFLK